MERDVGRAHLAQLPADGRGSLEQGQKFGRHDLADGVVVLHGKHTRAGTHIHTVGDGAVKDGGLASLGRAADVRFFHLGIAPRVHDPRKVRIHIKAEAAARVGAVLHDDVFRSPYRKGSVGTAAENILLAGGEAKGVHQISSLSPLLSVEVVVTVKSLSAAQASIQSPVSLSHHSRNCGRNFSSP